MLDLNTVLQVLTLMLLAVGIYTLNLFKSGAEAAVKTSAEEMAKAVVRERNWANFLAQELQKTRGTERQELRFKSYGSLWKELRPLAIYDAAVLNKKSVSDLYLKLSDWYFSEYGGLLLTTQAREFYFALQDLLRSASKVPEEWNATRSEEPQEKYSSVLSNVLSVRNSNGAHEAISVLNYFDEGNVEDWQERASDLGKKWRNGIREVAVVWHELDERQRFASLQQAGSKLRTCLVIDIESRLL